MCKKTPYTYTVVFAKIDFAIKIHPWKPIFFKIFFKYGCNTVYPIYVI